MTVAVARPVPVWLVGTCACASMASMRVCDAMLPAFAAAFDASAGQAARTISAFAIAYGVLQLLFGPLGDRYGKLRVIGAATLACTVGSTAAAFSPSLDWLTASRVLSGAAAAGIIPLTMAWIGDTVAYDERQAVLAQLLSATVFGMIAGQWLGGLLAETLGWRAAFAALAVVFATFGGMLLFRTGGSPTSPRPAPQGLIRGFRAIVTIPWAQTILVVVGIEGALAFSALAFIPSHLHLRFGLSMPQAGAVVALYGLGGLIYSRTARPLLRRIGEPGLARVGGVCMAIAFATIGFAPSWHWTLPACLVAGFGFYALHNTLQTHATQMAPSARGSAVALFACCLFFGQSLGVSMAAGLVDRFSTSIVFMISASGLLLVGLLFGRRVQRRVVLD
ncbi:MFS transporter [Variovorax sp. RHLX14]|uniref:MFS transporter n=1 Tax=Variovorax sp. RHLX14 TaxID=1259731 RepID=UPI003F446815